MKNTRRVYPAFVSGVVALALASGAPMVADADADGRVVVSRSVRTVAGVTYTFDKLMDARGTVRGRIQRDGATLDSVPQAAPPFR